MSSSNFPIRRLGTGERHHFFGYYNKTPWDKSGRCVLAQRVPMMDARLTPQLRAEIGYFDLQDGEGTGFGVECIAAEDRGPACGKREELTPPGAARL